MIAKMVQILKNEDVAIHKTYLQAVLQPKTH